MISQIGYAGFFTHFITAPNTEFFNVVGRKEVTYLVIPSFSIVLFKIIADN